MPKDKHIIESGLERKGFVKKERDHHYFRYFTEDGLKTPIYTKTSHGNKSKEINDSLLSEMAKQCRLTQREFILFVDCSLDRSSYERILKEKGFL